MLSRIKDFLQNIAIKQRKPTAQMPELFLLISKIYQSTPFTHLLRAVFLLSYLRLSLNKYFLNVLFCLFVYWDRERQNTSRGGPEREGDTVSEAGSRLWAVSAEPNLGLEPMNREIMTWVEVGCLTNWATQATHSICIISYF